MPLRPVHEAQSKLSITVDEVIATATPDDPVIRFRSVGEYLAAVGTALGMEAGRVTAQPLEASYPYWRRIGWLRG